MSNHQSNDRWMLEMFSFSVALIGFRLPLPRLLKGPFTEDLLLLKRPLLLKPYGHRTSRCVSTNRRQSICRFSFTHLTHLLNSFELDLVMSLLIYWLRLPRSSRVSQTLSVYTRQGDTVGWYCRVILANESFELIGMLLLVTDSSKWFKQMSSSNEFGNRV